MKRIGHTSFALLICLAVPGICFAWGADGYKIVGQIAWDHLNPDAKLAVKALLGDDTLPDAALWTDEIKSDPSYDWAKPLHYANVEPGAGEFDLERDCPEEGCVVSAIIRYKGVLRDHAATRAEKLEALKFIVHFVGDIHQPLHVSHTRDKGGNDIRVFFFHDNTNLHHVWDSGLIRHTRRPWSEYAEDLNQAITPHAVGQRVVKAGAEQRLPGAEERRVGG